MLMVLIAAGMAWSGWGAGRRMVVLRGDRGESSRP
jgi:hypothetical protein